MGIRLAVGCVLVWGCYLAPLSLVVVDGMGEGDAPERGGSEDLCVPRTSSVAVDLDERLGAAGTSTRRSAGEYEDPTVGITGSAAVEP
jgi:hypothetical protein